VKKNAKIFTLISLILFVFICPAYAKPDRTGNWNFNETTGLINIPSARIMKHKTAVIYIRMAKLGKRPPLKDKSQSSSPGPSTGKPWDSDWWIDNDGDRGLRISPIKNVELNFMNVHSYQLAPVVAGKVVVLEETKSLPAVTIGVQNVLSAKEDKAHSQEVQDANGKPAPFIAATKSIGSGDGFMDLTVGYGGGRFRNKIFYGGELFLDKKHYFSALGEYDGNVINYGVKYRLPGNRWDFGFFIEDKNQPGFTFSYTIPF